MKKICHITSVHPPEDGRIFRRACVSAAKAGYDTYLIEKGDTYDKEGVHIIGIGQPEKKDRLYRMTVFSQKAYKEALKVDADLYHLHDPELLQFAIRLKRKGKKVIFDSHEDYLSMIKAKTYIPFSRQASFLFYNYAKHVYAKIDGLVNAGNDEYISPFKDVCKRVINVDNYPWKAELYDLYDGQSEKENRTACYIGALDGGRGIKEIVKACSFAKCKLYLAGPYYSEQYKAEVEALPEFECVKYLGVIDRKQILELLKKTEIGLCVLLDVGQYYSMRNLSTKVYEYMSMAMPVIMNDSAYNKKICEKIRFGTCVNPNDIEEIASAIKNLLNNPELMREYGSNGRKVIADEYCWDIEQHKLLNLYEDILAE